MKQQTSKRITRNLNGVLILHKALGISSNRALQQVKHLFQAAKAGHTGSLDPLASGVLPICFGDATKYSSFLLDADKTYKVTAKLGVTTTTADLEGEILETKPVPEFTSEQINQAISKFLGASKQIPSMYSALKHEGQPLYKLARQNITIERPARDIFISDFTLLAQTSDTLSFSVTCSKGTYIRNLIEDLGTALGCGAHVIQLERTAAGPFKIQHAFKFEELEQAENLDRRLLPMECLVADLPKIALTEPEAGYILNGRKIQKNLDITGTVALNNHRGQFIGIGEILEDGVLVARRLNTTNA